MENVDWSEVLIWAGVILGALSTILGVAAAIAAKTETKRDDQIVGKLQRLVSGAQRLLGMISPRNKRGTKR